MRAYIIRRLLLIIPTLFILSILVFLSVRFIPGDVIDVMAGTIDSTQMDLDREAVERIDKQSIRAGPASSELPVVVGVAGARSDRLD